MMRITLLVVASAALAFGCGKSPTASDAALPTTTSPAAMSATPTAENVQSAVTSDTKALPPETATATPMIALVPKPVDSAVAGDKTSIRRVKMDDAELVRLVGSLPTLLAQVGPEVRFFSSGDAGEIARKAKERDKDPVAGVVFSASPVLWNPEGTQEYLVFSGRSKHSAFVAALKLIAPSSYELVSSFVFQREVMPVVLAFKSGSRRELFWTSCWGCPGDQGGVSIRDDHHVVIVQH